MKNTTIVLFGATGDLAKRKIIPALYRFVEKKKLENIIIVGVAFDDVTSDEMIDAAMPFVQNGTQENWDMLRSHSYYKKTNFTEHSDFVSLHEFVEKCEQQHTNETTNRLFYLATGANFFCSITQSLGKTQLGCKKAQEQPIVY